MQKKIILITGGSSGIGKAAAKQLHQLGAKIILQARNIEKLKIAANEISPSGERISFYSTDLTLSSSVENSAQEIIEKEGLPDVIINSAGSGEWLSLKEATPDYYKSSIESPYLATAYTCKVFFDAMKKRGTGHFIIVNSAASYFSFPGATGYNPARWAMLGFAQSLQADLFNTPFKVSLVALGKVDSPYFINNPVSEERIPKISNWLIPTLSDKQAAEVIVQNVNNPKNHVIRPKILSFFVFLNRLFPGIFRWLMRI